MSDGGYRDGRTGLVQHLEEAEIAVAERTARMTPALAKMLPARLRARLDELRSADHPRDDSVAELTRFIDARAALLEALDEAIALGPSLGAELRDVSGGAPTPPPQEDPWGPAGTEAAIVPILAEARRTVAGLDPAAEVRSSGARIVAELTLERTPLLWTVELGAYVNTNTGLEVRVSFFKSAHSLAVNVPPKLPRLVLRPERLGDGLLKLLRLEHDVEQGDATFDRAFLVEGDEAFVRPLLTPHVRARLLERRAVGGFHLVLEDGRAALEWTALGTSLVEPEPLASSARALVALRHGATSLELVRT